MTAPDAPEGLGGRRQQLTRALGAQTAKQLDWDVNDYTKQELAALGEQMVVDHALHGDDTHGARLIVAYAEAAGAIDAKALARGDHDQVATQVSDFLGTEFKNELGVSQAAMDLARLEMPTRHALARALLREIGLDPQRRVETPEWVDPENLLANNDRKTAVDYYFNYDTLSADDLRQMTDRPLTTADIAAMLARLPASLDAEFGKRFDAYAQAAAEQTGKLIDLWLDGIARKHGADWSKARVEVSAARLQFYQREVQVLRGAAFLYDGKPVAELPADGYFATIHTGQGQYRYFLCPRNASASMVPAGTNASDWALQNQAAVFAPDSAGKQMPRTTPVTLKRVALDNVGTGQRDQFSTWLTPALRTHLDKPRNEARAQTPAEHSVDILLDFIPFRRMVVAIQRGDIETALAAGSMDAMLFLVPLMCAGLRLAAGAARGLAPMLRFVGREFAAGGLAGVRSAMTQLPELRASIKATLESFGGAATEKANVLRPLDAEALANRLHARHPKMAASLRQAAMRERGRGIADGWYRAPRASAAAGDAAADADITALKTVKAHDSEGGALTVMPYGDDSGRGYTRVDAAGRRTGAVLLADRDGLLYQSLRADTLERYRVNAPDILASLASKQPAADGTLVRDGKTYARILDDYVEVAREHAAVAGRPAWRVIARQGAERDIVTHRLFYDTDKALWRRADVPELHGGGSRWSAPRRQASPQGGQQAGQQENPQGGQQAGQQTSQEANQEPNQHVAQPTRRRPLSTEATAVEEEQPAPKRSAPEPSPTSGIAADPPALPNIGPTDAQLGDFREHLLSNIRGAASSEQVDAVRKLLVGAQADRRGRAILSAMQAYHELLDGVPEIALRTADDATQPRPSLQSTMAGSTRWNLDLEALKTEGPEASIRELAAVYNNMTGLLRNENPFAALIRANAVPLHAEHEQAWARWVGPDKGHTIPGTPLFTPSPRQAAVDYLRLQLQEARCLGGMDRMSLEAALRNQTQIPRLRVSLARQQLTAIPPLPGDVLGLDISINPITDWSNLPRRLKILYAANTGPEILKHLPPDLLDLDISGIQLSSVPEIVLPGKLRSVGLNETGLKKTPAFPATLRQISIADNDLEEIGALPPRLKKFVAHTNKISTFPSDLPASMLDLDLSENRITTIPEGAIPDGMLLLDLSENYQLTSLPRLTDTLRSLCVNSTGLTELPPNLPRHLRFLSADDLGLMAVPDDLPPNLVRLSLQDNDLTHLPPIVTELDGCEINLEGNPIFRDDLPPPAPGRRGPVFYLSEDPGGQNATAYSGTLSQATRLCLEDQFPEAALRWDAIGKGLENGPENAHATLAFRRFLDRLRESAVYKNSPELRASVRQLLVELSKPEREALLKTVLQVCVGATAHCDDRVAWTLDEIRTLFLQEDILAGQYKGRPAAALDAMKQLWRLRQLRDIARREVESMKAARPGTVIDDVEVYLGYTVKLRRPLGLTTVVDDMQFFRTSGLTQEKLDAALLEVQGAERTEFYKDLVVDSTWREHIAKRYPQRYQDARNVLHQRADQPLQERISAELTRRQLDPADEELRVGISAKVWRDMEYEVLEPLTRDYLNDAGITLANKPELEPAT
jgi:Leucine-rich repeat (LRR) protein